MDISIAGAIIDYSHISLIFIFKRALKTMKLRYNEIRAALKTLAILRGNKEG
jgi:hypothetical protein